jgi:hypothetical protein
MALVLLLDHHEPPLTISVLYLALYIGKWLLKHDIKGSYRKRRIL